jgi:hypothetical protein
MGLLKASTDRQSPWTPALTRGLAEARKNGSTATPQEYLDSVLDEEG